MAIDYVVTSPKVVVGWVVGSYLLLRGGYLATTQHLLVTNVHVSWLDSR